MAEIGLHEKHSHTSLRGVLRALSTQIIEDEIDEDYHWDLVAQPGSDEERDLFYQVCELTRSLEQEDEPHLEFWRLCCLRAKKYDVNRAADLITRYLEWRRNMAISSLSITSDIISEQIDTGKLRITGAKDRERHPIINLRLAFHDTSQWSALDMLQFIHFHLEYILRTNPVAQFEGVTIINDLTNLSFNNIDPRVPKELFNALQNCFPIRVKRICILNPPWFFRLVFPIVSRFLSPKLRERVEILENSECLARVVDENNLLVEYGGKFVFDHAAWKEQTTHDAHSIWSAVPPSVQNLEWFNHSS